MGMRDSDGLIVYHPYTVISLSLGATPSKSVTSLCFRGSSEWGEGPPKTGHADVPDLAEAVLRPTVL